MCRINWEGDFDLDVECENRWVRHLWIEIWYPRYGFIVLHWERRFWLDNEGWVDVQTILAYRIIQLDMRRLWYCIIRIEHNFAMDRVLVDSKGHWNITGSEVNGRRNRTCRFESLNFQRSGSFHLVSTWEQQWC